MDDPLPQSPYKTLSVPKDATLATIRSAHRKLVLACHPDKVQDEASKKMKAEQFHQVQQAYEILSDDHRRQRYDEKVKLAELRAEMDYERGPVRRSESYASPRTNGHSPVVEVRQGRVYVERVPNSSRAYQEDVFAQKFAESRPSARKYDEMFADPIPTSSRRSSGRVQEDKRRMKEVEAERERRARDVQKAKEAAAREEKDRRRTKDRKREVEAKLSRSNKFNTYMDTNDSDSEMDDRYYNSRRETTPPKRRHEELRRDKRDEPRRSSKREDLRKDRDYEDEVEAKTFAAQDYMSRSREAVEIEPRNRSSRKRADSNLERSTPPAPPPPPGRPVDTRRRSSDRERSDNQRSDKEKSGGEKDRRRGGRGSRQPSPVRRDSGKKDKKFREPEIVDASPSSRKPSLPGFTSDPKGLAKNLFGVSSRKEQPRRSETYQAPAEFKHPGMRRAETMPINQMRRSDPVPLKSSHLKNAKAPSDVTTSSEEDDSEDSDETPEIKPRMTSHKYKVQADEAQSPRTVVMEPEEMYSPRPRDDSPPKNLHRRASDRPSMAGRGSSTRTPPTRSMSYAQAEDRPSPRPTGPSRGESMRGMPSPKTHGSGRGNKLFGAVDEDEEMPYSRMHSSPKMSPIDIRYSNKPRRASEDVDRDAFPGSLHKSHRRPSYPRGAESVY